MTFDDCTLVRSGGKKVGRHSLYLRPLPDKLIKATFTRKKQAEYLAKYEKLCIYDLHVKPEIRKRNNQRIRQEIEIPCWLELRRQYEEQIQLCNADAAVLDDWLVEMGRTIWDYFFAVHDFDEMLMDSVYRGMYYYWVE